MQKYSVLVSGLAQVSIGKTALLNSATPYIVYLDTQQVASMQSAVTAGLMTVTPVSTSADAVNAADVAGNPDIGITSWMMLNADIAATLPLTGITTGSSVHIVDRGIYGTFFAGHWYNLNDGTVIK